MHRISATHYLLCVNAGNQDQDFEYVRSHNRFGADVENTGDRYTQLSVQGPKALDILQRLTQVPIASLKYYHFTFGQVDGVDCLIARTGYTGEDGFEIYFSPEHSERIWNDLARGGPPGGLASLRAGRAETRCAWKRRCASTAMRSTKQPPRGRPVWAGSAKWIKAISWDASALLAQKQSGIRRALVGFEMQDQRIARDGCAVWIGGHERPAA